MNRPAVVADAPVNQFKGIQRRHDDDAEYAAKLIAEVRPGSDRAQRRESLRPRVKAISWIRGLQGRTGEPCGSRAGSFEFAGRHRQQLVGLRSQALPEIAAK